MVLWWKSEAARRKWWRAQTQARGAGKDAYCPYAHTRRTHTPHHTTHPHSYSHTTSSAPLLARPHTPCSNQPNPTMANGAGSTNRNYNSPLGSPLGTKINVAIFLFCALGGLITGCILLAVGLQRQQFFNALNPTSSSCGVDPCGDFSTQPGQCTILDVYQRNILKSEKNGKKGMKDVCYAQLSYEFTGPFAKATGDSILRPSSQEIVAALNTPGAMDHFNDKGGDTMGLKRYGGWKLARRPRKALSRLESTTAFAGRVAMSRVESIRLHDGECDFPQDSPKDASSTKNGYFQRGGETGDEKAEDYGGKSSMRSFWVGDETDCWQANDVIHVQKTAVIDGINA